MSEPIKVPTEIRIVIVFDACLLDREHEEDEQIALGDYTGVEVYFDTELAKTYGDHYHEKGLHCATTFVQGARYAWETAFGIVVAPTVITSRVDRSVEPSMAMTP